MKSLISKITIRHDIMMTDEARAPYAIQAQDAKASLMFYMDDGGTLPVEASLNAKEWEQFRALEQAITERVRRELKEKL